MPRHAGVARFLMIPRSERHSAHDNGCRGIDYPPAMVGLLTAQRGVAWREIAKGAPKVRSFVIEQTMKPIREAADYGSHPVRL